MRGTALALAYDTEYDEVPVSSVEVIEANVIALREELKEHKAEFKDFRTEMRAANARLDQDIKAAVLRLDNDIKAAVSELRAEIRAMAAKAESDLKAYADRTDKLLSEMRNEYKELREEQKEFRKELAKVAADVSTIGSKLNALFWVLGGLVALAGLAKTLGWL